MRSLITLLLHYCFKGRLSRFADCALALIRNTCGGDMTFTLAAVMALGKKEKDSAKGMESRPRLPLGPLPQDARLQPARDGAARQCRSGCGVGNVGTDGPRVSQILASVEYPPHDRGAKTVAKPSGTTEQKLLVLFQSLYHNRIIRSFVHVKQYHFGA